MISQGQSMLDLLAGTEQYDALKQQFDEAADRAEALPYEEQSIPPSQEIGPGITHEAVSYTHLDVYKRQVPHSLDRISHQILSHIFDKTFSFPPYILNFLPQFKQVT